MNYDRRNLAPWDAIRYFLAPQETVVPANPIVGQLVGQNPNRVALLMDVTAGSNAQVSTRPGVTVNDGFVLQSVRGPLEITFATHGSLVTVPWYVIGPGGISVTVLEMILKEWPR